MFSIITTIQLKIKTTREQTYYKLFVVAENSDNWIKEIIIVITLLTG